MADLRGSGYGNAIAIDSSDSEGDGRPAQPAPRVHQGPPPSRRQVVVNPRPSQLKAGRRPTSTGKTLGGAGATGTGSEADGEGDDSLGLPSVTQKKRERQESSASPQWDGGAWRKKGNGKGKSKEKHKRNSERASDTSNLDGTGSRSRPQKKKVLPSNVIEISSSEDDLPGPSRPRPSLSATPQKTRIRTDEPSNSPFRPSPSKTPGGRPKKRISILDQPHMSISPDVPIVPALWRASASAAGVQTSKGKGKARAREDPPAGAAGSSGAGFEGGGSAVTALEAALDRTGSVELMSRVLESGEGSRNKRDLAPIEEDEDDPMDGYGNDNRDSPGPSQLKRPPSSSPVGRPSKLKNGGNAPRRRVVETPSSPKVANDESEAPSAPTFMPMEQPRSDTADIKGKGRIRLSADGEDELDTLRTPSVHGSPLLAAAGASASTAAPQVLQPRAIPPSAAAGPSRLLSPPTAVHSRTSTDPLDLITQELDEPLDDFPPLSDSVEPFHFIFDDSVPGTAAESPSNPLPGDAEEEEQYSDDALERALTALVDDPNILGGDDDGLDLLPSPDAGPSRLSSAAVEDAIEDATVGVDEVDIADPAGPSSDTGLERVNISKVALRVRAEFAAMSREEKMALIEREGRPAGHERGRADWASGSGAAGSASVVKDGVTIAGSWSFKPPPDTSGSGLVSRPRSPASDAETDGLVIEHPPDRYRGVALRHVSTEMVDQWNMMLPQLTHKPALHRLIFQQIMADAHATTEPYAGEIFVTNSAGSVDAAPEIQYQYGNEVMYHPGVPDPDTGTGCGCVGPCNPNDGGCRCVRRQELYFAIIGMTGFAYNEDGTVKNLSCPIWECGPNCGCPPSCMNRRIQRGRGKNIELDLFKTRQKGWGVKTRQNIPIGTFVGMYSGELIPHYESDRRATLYDDQIGRTYLFDCEGWHIRHPPDLNELCQVDPRLAELAAQTVERYEAAVELAGVAELTDYSKYSVDAFHYGYTRYFNHSCDPNLIITPAYVYDYHPERPKLIMFARKNIAAGEEMCISYRGSDSEDDAAPVKPRKKTYKRPRTKRVGARRMGASKAGSKAALERCRCGAPNCKGFMFPQ
ncbi:uncharacterized protein MKK02DRAFT_41086 [Dioszegia hungarica]|uniref:SET domain-containing protein n=1 Tax=Dioszegia hungarica TaxID=4972 RepID=A0AA38LTP1_9TREE|nr:uncharacterized protein MKK02DRAFT_41086 [Dioszegia hungarica]KAI9632776.1 hypothetical protein MKK02DRAFT_41086 [Dioszegia hungarica]